MGPNLPIFGFFGHFLEFESLDFSDFAYYDRQAWYLADTGGPMAEKNFPGPNLGYLGPNLAQNQVFGKYLDLDSYDLSDIAHSDWFPWYLTTNGGFLFWPKIFGPKLGQFRPKFGPKSGFRQISQLSLIRYVWYCTFWFISMIFNY